MEFEGRRVLVLGLGVSGRSAVRFLAERGADVVAADERDATAIEGLEELPGHVTVRVGEAFPALAEFDLVVPSPGVPRARYAEAACAWGDIELCGRALAVPIVAVTGTNGKSTVVTMIERMACAAGLRAQAAGNVGLPALALVGRALDLAVLEVSSFQLESVERFAPRTGVLLNLSPDHLDRHGDLEGYRAAKARLFAAQREGHTAILNGDDPLVRDLALPVGVERLEFRQRTPVDAGAWLDGETVLVRRGGRLTKVDLAGVPGLETQLDNVLASLLALDTLGVDLDAAARALIDFEGLPHRCRTIATLRGVRWIDDSKATNVGAAARSLAAVPGPLVWIAGGRHKGGELDALADAARGRVRRALLIGEAAHRFERDLADAVACEVVGDLETAVARAAAIAHAGDAVLLAPACASFDQFRSFEDRGETFTRLVLGDTSAARSADGSPGAEGVRR